jgi:hypothetical protein
MIYANIAFDSQIWIPIPTWWGPETWPGPQKWAEHVARGLWEGHRGKRDEIRRSELEFATYGDLYGGTDPELPFEVMTYLHVPHPKVLAMPVRVWVDDVSGLGPEEAAEVTDEEAVEPPIVEEFVAPYLAPGLKALRYRQYDPDPGGPEALYAVLRYAFRLESAAAVVVVNATDTDPGRLLGAVDDLDEFVRQIRWSYEPEDLLGP